MSLPEAVFLGFAMVAVAILAHAVCVADGFRKLVRQIETL